MIPAYAEEIRLSRALVRALEEYYRTSQAVLPDEIYRAYWQLLAHYEVEHDAGVS